MPVSSTRHENKRRLRTAWIVQEHFRAEAQEADEDEAGRPLPTFICHWQMISGDQKAPVRYQWGPAAVNITTALEWATSLASRVVVDAYIGMLSAGDLRVDDYGGETLTSEHISTLQSLERDAAPAGSDVHRWCAAVQLDLMPDDFRHAAPGFGARLASDPAVSEADAQAGTDAGMLSARFVIAAPCRHLAAGRSVAAVRRAATAGADGLSDPLNRPGNRVCIDPVH